MRHRKSMTGFTLIEVMVVVAVVGILAAIAYSSYSNQVIRSNRSDAKVALSDTAQRLQRCFTTYSAYNNANCGVFTQVSNGITSGEGLYAVTIENPAATYYTLVAKPARAPQTSDTQCPEIRLTHTGQRTPEECW